MIAYLRLNGVNAKDHPVFRELTRVKQYFEKINNAESDSMNRSSMALDKAAAGRFIKHALAGNKPYGIDAEQNEKTKVGVHIKFEQVSKKRKIEDHQGAALPAQVLSSQVSSTSSSESEQPTIDATAPESVAQPIVKEGTTKQGGYSKRGGKKQQSQAQKKEPDTQG